MHKNKKNTINSQGGFAFIAALLATLLITSLVVLIFSLTTRDVRVSIKSAGEKMAASAAESAIQQLILQSDNSNGLISNYVVGTATAVNPSNPNNTGYYTISNNTPPGNVPASRPISGYAMGGTGATQSWSDKIYNKSVQGTDSRYNSEFDLDIGIAYGPIDMSTQQPGAGG